MVKDRMQGWIPLSTTKFGSSVKIRLMQDDEFSRCIISDINWCNPVDWSDINWSDQILTDQIHWLPMWNCCQSKSKVNSSSKQTLHHQSITEMVIR